MTTCIVNIVLAFAGQNDLTVYFTVNVIAYLIITLLQAYLNPQSRKLLSTIAGVLFGGFLVIMLIKVTELLAKGTSP